MSIELLAVVFSLIKKGYHLPIVCTEMELFKYVKRIKKAGLKLTNQVRVDEYVILYVAKGASSDHK